MISRPVDQERGPIQGRIEDERPTHASGVRCRRCRCDRDCRGLRRRPVRTRGSDPGRSDGQGRRRDADGTGPPSQRALEDDSRQRRRAGGRVELARGQLGCDAGLHRARLSEERHPAVEHSGGSQCDRRCGGSQPRTPQGTVGAGRPANGALSVHATPQRRRLRAERVRGRWANDRPRDRSELRPAGPSLPDVDHARRRRGLAHEERAPSPPQVGVPVRELRDQLDRLDHDRPERPEWEHALGRHG